MINIHLSDSEFTLSGRFSRAELERESYAEVKTNKNESYTVTCQDLDNIDSFFVVWLIGLQRTLNSQGSRFVIRSPSEALSRLITLYRLEDILFAEI